MVRLRVWLWAMGVAGLGVLPLEAARIGDVNTGSWQEQAWQFWQFSDASVRYAVAGAVLVGVLGGALGCLILVRRLALLGDTLAHAVLPGVALGFLWNATKDSLPMLVGATVAGGLGVLLLKAILRTTHLKEDTAMGIILSGFYAVGIVLLSMIENEQGGQAAGLEHFLMGQAAALHGGHLWQLGLVCAALMCFLVFFYRLILTVSFDAVFARCAGLSVWWVEYGILLFLALTIVVCLQAVGVVLVSAMLIIPAATAYLLTRSFSRMLGIAVLVGVVSGVLGCFFSFLGNHLPTGPLMVLVGVSLFGLAFLFSPQEGVWLRWRRLRLRRYRTQMENVLKSIYKVREQNQFAEESVRVQELAQERNVSLMEAEKEVRLLVKNDYVQVLPCAGSVSMQDDRLLLTAAGWQRAQEIVRNHRLWELYLTNRANYSDDHVHEDAEKIEHVLGEDTVRSLEKILDFPQRDPHGKPIPQTTDIGGHEGRVRHD